MFREFFQKNQELFSIAAAWDGETSWGKQEADQKKT